MPHDRFRPAQAKSSAIRKQDPKAERVQAARPRRDIGNPAAAAAEQSERQAPSCAAQRRTVRAPCDERKEAIEPVLDDPQGCNGSEMGINAGKQGDDGIEQPVPPGQATSACGLLNEGIRQQFTGGVQRMICENLSKF